MKGLLLTLYSLTTLFAFSQSESDNNSKSSDEFEHHCLIEEKSFTIGLGAIYSLEKELLGVNSRFYYNIGEHICFGPEVSLIKNEVISIYDIDLVAHYIFETKWVGIYPLLGANYTYKKERGHSEEALGVVFGAGVHRNFNNIVVFGEYSRVQSELSDDFIALGLMFK